MTITATELIRQTLQTYEHNFKEISKYISLSLIIWVGLAFNSVYNIPLFIDTLGKGTGLIVSVIAQLTILALFVIITIAFTRVLKKLYHHEIPGTIWTEIKSVKNVFFPFLISSFLLGIIVFAGSLLLLIPGIIFAIWFYFAPFAAILDNQSAIISLKTSYRLVSGRFGSTLWNIVAPTVVYMIVFLTFSWMILSPGKYFLATSGMTSGYWISIGLAIVFYFLFLPILTLTPVIQYENLKESVIPLPEEKK